MRHDEGQRAQRWSWKQNPRGEIRWLLALLPVFWLCSCAPVPPQDFDDYERSGETVRRDRSRSSIGRSSRSARRVSSETGRDRAEPTSASRRTKHFTLRLGELSLDKDDYDPVDEQTSFGLEFSDELPGSWIGYEFGFRGSYDSTDVGVFDVRGSTSEVYGGVVKHFGSGPVRPFLGGGLSIINAEIEVSSFGFFGSSDSEDDSSPAGYIHGGVVWDITEGFFVGVDARVLFGSDLSINGFDTDADYEDFGVLVGFSY